MRVAGRAAYREEQRTVATSIGEKSVIICDLCGEAKDCLQKEIEDKEYDICFRMLEPVRTKAEGEKQSEGSGNCVFTTAERVQRTGR